MKQVKNNYVNEIIDIAQKYDIAIPVDYTYGVKTSTELNSEGLKSDPNSAYGEKTAQSIIEKVTRKILNEENEKYNILHIPDLVRVTVVLEKHSHIPMYLDLLKHEFPDLTGEMTYHPNRGYLGTHLATRSVDGICSDIQIVTPVQRIANTITHKLYQKSRNYPKDSIEQMLYYDKIRDIYKTLWRNTDLLNGDTMTRAKILDFGKNIEQSDTKRLPVDLVKLLSKSSAVKKKGKSVMNERLLEEQSLAAQGFAVPAQVKFTRINEQIFEQYKDHRRNGRIESADNKNQNYIDRLFKLALEREKPNADDYVATVSDIQERAVAPYLKLNENSKKPAAQSAGAFGDYLVSTKFKVDLKKQQEREK
jgi:RNase P subunit RPR2